MALMMLLPPTAGAYAVRTAVVLGLLFWSLWPFRHKIIPTRKEVAVGLCAGLLVFIAWVLPEGSAFYQKWCIIGDSPNVSIYDPSICGWPLVLIRLFGSAFVIAVAEEIFFRKFLIDFAGFWWMVVLFAIEHDRFLVAFIAGVIYGIVKIKVSLKSAIIAHIVTNFILGIYVIRFAKWQFW
jgi:CAAX prenyl protease-like protein